MLDKSKRYEGFTEKVWLSSRTMHGDELKYMVEAYETNWGRRNYRVFGRITSIL